MFGGRPASARAPLVQRSGDWLLVCDNRRSCTILGAVRPEQELMRGYARVIFRFTRENEGGAPLLLQTHIVNETGGPHPRSSTTIAHLSLSDEPMGLSASLPPVDHAVSNGEGVEGFTAENSAHVALIIVRDRPIYLREGMGAFAAMPRGDFEGLMRRMDDAQPAVPRPRVETPPVRQERFLYEIFPSEEVSRPIEHPVFMRTCLGTRRQASAYKVDHLAVEGTLLVLLQCGGSDHLFTWYPAGGAPPVPMRLRRRISPRDSVMSGRFNADAGVLTITDHPPGRTDCGAQHDWGWVAGEGMVLLTTRIMPDCRGVRPALWPVQFMQLGWAVR